MMRAVGFFLWLCFFINSGAVQAQLVIPLLEKGALHAAYVVPTETFNRVDVQLIVLSGAFDDPDPSGTAHLTEHLAAFSADKAILRRPRARDLNATLYDVATVYTNSGPPSDAEKLLRLSRAVLDRPSLPEGFAESEIDIIQRETLLHERNSPRRWLRRIVRQKLYGTLRGRANNVIEDLPKLSLDKAYQFHKEHYAPSNVTLIVSGKIQLVEATELVARIFGDTKWSPAPPKPWLDEKPDPSLRSVEYVESDRLVRDTLQFAKFVDFENQSTSFNMQGAFFITTTILRTRLENALYFEDMRFFKSNIDWHFTKNTGLELTIDVQLMPGFSLDEAHASLLETMANLLNEPITNKEIHEARQEEVTFANYLRHRPERFLSFLKNVASDGFPPISPSGFVNILNDVTDQEVIDFAKTAMKPSATSVILAKKVD